MNEDILFLSDAKIRRAQIIDKLLIKGRDWGLVCYSRSSSTRLAIRKTSMPMGTPQ